MSHKYKMDKIKRNLASESLFFNNLEKIERSPEEKFIHRAENKIKLNKKMPEVEYLFNSFGFRSDEFKTEHDGEHILFAGCSETEGVGGNLDSCWAYMLYSELLKEKKMSGFFNLGRAGWGYASIISNIMSYIQSYGKPDKIFILFPNIGRFYQWNKEASKYLEVFEHRSSIPYGVNTDELEIYPETKKELNVEKQRELFVNFVMLMKVFEEYCISSNIELFWSTWSHPDLENLKQISIFKKYIEMDNVIFLKENEDLILKIQADRQDWASKRDDHSGYLLHFLWYKKFFSYL